MDVKRNVLTFTRFMLLLFALLLINVVYLHVFTADSLAQNPMNRRNAMSDSSSARGSIFDAQGRALAQMSGGSRSYPMGMSMAAVTGYTTTFGSMGMEAYGNRDLLGKTGEQNAFGPAAQLFGADVGNDIYLTVDADAEQAAYDGLAGRRGAAVVLDIATGAVVALVSSPSYNPATVADEWDSLIEREDSPLLNRALYGLYPPGSTIKPMIADWAMRTGMTDTREVFDCTGVLDVGGGYTIKESHDQVHGHIKLDQALIGSCNVVFGTLAMRMGARELKEAFKAFGFELAPEGEVKGETPHLPDFDALDQGDIAQVGIGQSTLLVTPMSMALLAEAFASGGVVMKPYMIDKVVSPDGAVLKEARPTKWFEATNKDRATMIDNWMEDVVQKGTGTSAKVSGIRMTGKTGTAENPAGDDHAWFIGSAKMGKRQLALAIIVENSGGGGTEAAPIARNIILSLDK